MLNVRQKAGETLKQYMARFRAISVKVEDSMPDACVGSIKNGLRSGSLNNKLIPKPASTMAEIFSRPHMYILEEEDDALKRQREEKAEGENLRLNHRSEEDGMATDQPTKGCGKY